MGGSIFVGIRKSDGTEHLGECWTNPLPFSICHPDFFNEGQLVDEYIQEMTERPKEIQPIQYGIVLIDFKNKKLISRQGYCSMRLLCFTEKLCYDMNDFSAIDLLIKNNLIKKIKSPFASITKQQELEVIEALKNRTEYCIQVHPNRSMFEIHPKFPFTVDEDDFCEEYFEQSWQPIINFVQDNDWQSKVWSMEEVEKYYAE